MTSLSGAGGVTGAAIDPSPATAVAWSVSPARLIDLAEEAFQRDLGQLLKGHPGKWAAYHGGQQGGGAATKADLHRECLQRGLPFEEVVLWHIEPVIGAMSIGPAGNNPNGSG